MTTVAERCHHPAPGKVRRVHDTERDRSTNSPNCGGRACSPTGVSVARGRWRCGGNDLDVASGSRHPTRAADATDATGANGGDYDNRIAAGDDLGANTDCRATRVDRRAADRGAYDRCGVNHDGASRANCSLSRVFGKRRV
jgi:hypothetical protein